MSPRHGASLRGLNSSRSHLAQGRFGRMFRELAPAQFGNDENETIANLECLAGFIESAPDPAEDRTDAEESAIPALYTYFGQFVDHDITFDPVSSLTAFSDPDALVDFRTPTFDLDSLYGRGPDDQPYMYDQDPKQHGKLAVGRELTQGSEGARDHPRISGRAVLGDPRNDENVIVSQLHGLFARLHNAFVDHYKDFETARNMLRYYYQYVVVNDFLSKIISEQVLAKLRGFDGKFARKNLEFYKWHNEPFIPTEFSVAAYRMGHSMVRTGYRLNDNVGPFLVFSGDKNKSLGGFSEFPATWGIDWARFVDIEVLPYGDENKNNQKNQRRLQLAYRMDTALVAPLADLQAGGVVTDNRPSLAKRNLVRGWRLGLPSGQDVARLMGVKPLSDDEILIGKHMDGAIKLSKIIAEGKCKDGTKHKLDVFAGNCPLWAYVLAEAMVNAAAVRPNATGAPKISTPKLGPVGGRIVAEVMLGLMYGDGTSYLRRDPLFVPTVGGVKRPAFTLADLVNMALGKTKP